MKKLGIIVLLCSLIKVSAAVVYVDKDNSNASDTTASGSEAKPFSSINYALSRIVGGDTIYIKNSSSPYSIGTSLTVQGPAGTAGSYTTIAAFPGHKPHIKGTGNNGRWQFANTSYWRIQGLEVSNFNHCLYFYTAHHIEVLNNDVHDSGNELIHILQDSHDILVAGNTLKDAGSLNPTPTASAEGIYIGTHQGGNGDITYNVTVRGNTIDTAKHEAVELKGDTHDCVVEDNVMSNCVDNYEYGRHTVVAQPPVNYKSNPNQIIRNNTIFNHHGGGVQGAAIGTYTGVQVYNNVIYGVSSPAFAVEVMAGNAAFSGYADNYTRYVWNNTMNVPGDKAIKHTGGTMNAGNNIGPTTAGNVAYNANLFVNAGANDYHLKAALPGVNPPFNIATDKVGVECGSPPDMGAYEFVSGGAPTPTPPPEPAVEPIQGLKFEAEAGVIVAPFGVSGGVVSQTGGMTAVSAGGSAKYQVEVPVAGDYTVKMKVNCSSAASDSFFVNFDEEPGDPTGIWDVGVTSGVEIRDVTWRGNGSVEAPQFKPKTWNLTKGQHTLIVRGREGGAQLDAIEIVASAAPTPTPTPTPNPTPPGVPPHTHTSDEIIDHP